MSSPLRILSAFALILLSACGFQPLYGDASMQATHTPLQGNMEIDTGKGREAQLLKADLEDRFNPEGIKYASPDYRLHVTITKTLIPAVVKNDGTIQRYDLRIDTNYQLFKNGMAAAVSGGSVRRVGSYNVTVNAEFATFEADRDTLERTLDEVAEDYVLRLSGFFAGNPKALNEKPDKPACGTAPGQKSCRVPVIPGLVPAIPATP